MNAKIKKIVCCLLLVAMTMSFTAVQTMAAELPKNGTTAAGNATVSSSSNPYTDVTVKKVGKDAYDAIKFLKAHKAFKNVVTGSKFYPNKKITRRQFILILRNLYGSKYVVVTNTDLKNMNKTITAKYACDKMIDIAKRAGTKGIKWDGSKSVVLTRAGAAVYIKIFVDFTKSWLPLKN